MVRLATDLRAGMAVRLEGELYRVLAKDQLVARLRKSFQGCMGIVAKLNESTLGDSVPFFGGRKATKARAAVALVTDWADHYAQAAMYLRLNNILPPSARRRM